MFRLLLFPALLLVLSCGNEKEKILPAEKGISESVYSSVTVQPDSLYQVYSIVNGILERNLVEEGELVKIGQPVIQIINSNPKLNTENARLSLQMAEKNFKGSNNILSGIEDEITAAQLKHTNDSINYTRQKNLKEKGIGSKAEFDNRKLNYELSLNSLNLLKNRYSLTKSELETQLKQAENTYRSSLLTTKDYTINSLIKGKVYSLLKEPGELVNSQQPLASIGSEENFIINMLVDEVDIVRISTGQQVIVSLDAYPAKIFRARVTKIYPQKDERNQTFKVEAAFLEPPEVLYPGLSGEANIIVNSRDSSLVIPKSYLYEDNKVKTEEGLVEIETGFQTIDSIEILSGITKDTWIYKPEK
ncbi:HlyD family efflux transporter periplasmic adaptor subunit [Antarcticibacterium flavum]|uniref:HlyD family efflux transporter periplasmic adaptor subunit n=1 Tax=Antarcticibacterium flavum TaxID=2058175 RepID=A0A5B7WYC2_9FLAO|nr:MULTISPECIES: HlyD family efflux transporter periplasmic adaptor subunit [Antarcticibacterium]MCM4160848.1 efflux transporter periplasmic adaptor subunit [Antarcticibacterium sp. W02-3]QCY68015.1 HlyD family efflux transporter periplasmic adaptor subunit [Antarcticibacterium flavum]